MLLILLKRSVPPREIGLSSFLGDSKLTRCIRSQVVVLLLLLLLLLSWSTKGPRRSKFFTGKGPRQLKGRNRGPFIFAAFYEGSTCRISLLIYCFVKVHIPICISVMVGVFRFLFFSV